MLLSLSMELEPTADDSRFLSGTSHSKTTVLIEQSDFFLAEPSFINRYKQDGSLLSYWKLGLFEQLTMLHPF